MTCQRICVSLPPGAVGVVRPSGDNQRTGPPTDSRRRHRVIVVVAVAVGPPRWALRHDHRWGGAVGSALVRMLLDDTTAASASAPDSGGTQAIISIPCRRLRTAGARKPSFPSPAAAVIAFERAVSRRLPRSAAVGRPAATMASGK